MALALREKMPEVDFEYVITPTGNELPDMFRHWLDLQERLGQFKVLTQGVSLQGLIRRWDALPNARMRWCTRVLKLEPFIDYVRSNAPCTVYVGLRADEETREGAVYGEVDGVEQRFPLREWGWGVTEVMQYLDHHGVKIPDRTDCALCYAQQLGEWWNLWKFHPELYEEGIKFEEDTGHTFRSDSRDTWPASLKELRQRFEQGEIPTRSKSTKYQGRLFAETGFNRGKCRVCSL